MSVKEASNEIVSHVQRNAVPANQFKLRGIDHVGLPCRDPDASGEFVERILGGVEIYRAGYSESDRKMGRLRHIFYHVGAQMVEVVEQEDMKSYPDHTNPGGANTNPHWSFGASPEDLAKFVAHLKAQKVPFNGPRSHKGSSAVSVYFRDLDGNNLEVTTWEPIPSGLVEVTPMGGEYGFIPWNDLSHNGSGK